MLKQMIGLEAEYLLRDTKTKTLVYPAKYGLGHDDFPLIGEFRADPGTTRAEVVGNFFKAYYTMLGIVRNKNLFLDLTGWATLSPKEYTGCLREMGNKQIATCKNIYGKDILELSDAVIDAGVVKGHNISNGLHIHFSSSDAQSWTPKKYTEVKIKDYPETLYRWNGEEPDKTLQVNRLTKPAITHIIKRMDKEVFPKYPLSQKLKYRQPGYYEVKSDGRFEYRSLPFSEDVYLDIYDIVDKAFDILESL
jgi:hypothetical protein